MQEVTEKGKTSKVLVGLGCQECYVIGVDVIGYSTFQAFSADFAGDAHNLKDKVGEIRGNIGKYVPAGKPDETPSDVLQNISYEVTFEKKFKAYNDLELKKNSVRRG